MTDRQVRTARNRENSLAAFLAKKAEFDAFLAELSQASADHFGTVRGFFAALKKKVHAVEVLSRERMPFGQVTIMGPREWRGYHCSVVDHGCPWQLVDFDKASSS